LVLSQSTRVTDGRTGGPNYDSKDRVSIAAGAVKTLLTRLVFFLSILFSSNCNYCQWQV